MKHDNFKTISRHAAVVLMAAAAMPAAAQLHEQISVEGKYVPDVIRIDRINTFPKALKLTLASEPIGYEQGGVAAAFNPSLLMMPATGWKADRYVSSSRGYLELGAGSWLNSTLSAGYRFIDNSTTLFGVRLQHNSTSLWKPAISERTADVKQERYDESIGLYASHVVKDYGRLDAAIDYHAGYFNYYGFAGYAGSEAGSDKAPTQTINDFAMRLDWRSLISPSATLSYHASARVRHFAYRALPLPQLPAAGATMPKGSRETEAALSGGLRMPWESGSSIGLDANLRVVLLSGGNDTAEGMRLPGSGITLPKVDNYGMLTLTPYYRFNKGLLDIRLGADVDLAFNAGPDGSRYSFFHIAPDVKFALQTGQVGLYLNALGGSELNTLAYLHELDYYGVPAAISSRPSFTPLDAQVGVNMGPFSGFSAGIEARYSSTKNVPLGGWYQSWLNSMTFTPVGLQPAVAQGSELLYSFDPDGINLHGASVAARLSYDHGETFSISAEGTLQPQDGEKGYFNGYDRPKVTAAIKASVKPIEPLRISAGYDFRGKRAIYTRSFAELGQGGTLIDGDNTTLHSLPLPDITLLNIAASWSFSHDMSVWIQADNLLNRHDEYFPMLPTQGLTVAGGFRIQF